MASCLKGTSFMCPCDDCVEELHQKALAHTAYLASLRNGVNRFWTDDYSAHDKMVTMVHVGAGHEPDPNCQCLKCQVARELQPTNA